MRARARREQLGGVPPAGAGADGDLPETEGPPPKLSLLRVAVALLALGGAGFGVFSWASTAIADSSVGPIAPTWFAPYVDATLTPLSQFQDATDDPDRQVVLGFVVSDPAAACTPSWGGYYTLAQAASQIQLDSRIAQLETNGGSAVVSFGGKANAELALSCTSVPRLEQAYAAVVDRYQLRTVDFDIEGPALQDWPSVVRRASAVAELQRQLRARGQGLAVWLTLPVSTSGLTAAGSSVVREMLRAGVQLAGVNVMAMDFGPPEPGMLQAVTGALDASHRQLVALLAARGAPPSSEQAWNRLGVTVMIGQNDDAGENFTVADASGLARVARADHLGRISIWSLNRDAQCGSEFPEVGTHSNTCSGTSQTSLAFDHLFSDQLAGTAGAQAQAAAGARQATGRVTAANDPYPAWQPDVPYVEGYKVVWQGSIYQAKWYNQGEDPNAQVQYGYQSPWLLIGPVLASDHAPTTTTLAPGTDPAWSPTRVYQAGDRVLYRGEPYQAKWYNQGSSPAAEQTDPTGSPWQPLFTIPGEPSSG